MYVHKVVIICSILVVFSLITTIIILLQKKPERVVVVPPPPPPPELIVITNNQITEEYRQIGIITSSETDKEPIILPLFARKLYGRSDRFQYYTMTDKTHMIHLPIQFNNRECEDRIGCDEIYSGDKITVTSYENREFTVTIYKRY